MRRTLPIMKFHQLERWCRANIDSQWMMLKRSFSDLLDTMRMTMGPRRMCPRTFDLWRCVPCMIRPLDDMSRRWFIGWNKHPMDYMSHGRMIPDQYDPTPSVREEISQHRTTDEMSPNTTVPEGCVPERLIFDDASHVWYVPWTTRLLDDSYLGINIQWIICMSHGRMIPDQCVPTPSVREEISQHRTTDEMSPNTTLYTFTDAGLMCPPPMCPRPKILGCCASWTKHPLDIVPLIDVSHRPWTASSMKLAPSASGI